MKTALKELKRVGCAHATGDSLRAMHAKLLEDVHGGNAAKYYAYLTGSDAEVTAKAKVLLHDRLAAWDILIA